MTGPMRRSTFLTAIALLLSWTEGSGAAAPNIAVVVNKHNGTERLNRDELRAIFQTKKTSWDDGKHIIALNLPSDDATRAQFDEVVLGMTPNEVARYWIDRKIRGGARPPIRLPNSRLVMAVVEKKREAIGYVREDQVTDAVRVVALVQHDRVSPP